MPRNGSGTFTAASSSVNPAVAGTTIAATAFNTLVDDIETGLTDSISRDGQTTTTAVIPFASGVKTDTVVENTSNAGVTIDSVLLKDGRVDTAKGSDIASATTTDIGAATGNYVDITGTTTITGLGTITAGRVRVIKFEGALTLTHNATSLILPGGANITTADGDIAVFVSEGSGNWRCVSYTPASGQPVTAVNGTKVRMGSDAQGDVLYFNGTNYARLAAGTSGQFLKTLGTGANPAWGDALLRSYLSGLGMSHAADADHDITIAVGSATDGTNAALLTLGAALTKQIDAAWSVGTNQGGIDTGSVANSTWYAVWLIRRSDTGVVDALFSTSASSPTMPSSYDQKRRIGWVKTDGSANIVQFVQEGDRFRWKTPVKDINASNPGTSAVTATLASSPVNVFADIRAALYDETAQTTYFRVFATTDTDAAVDGSNLDAAVYYDVGSRNGAQAQMLVSVDSSRQVKYRLSASTADHVFDIVVKGWIDRRGRDD